MTKKHFIAVAKMISEVKNAKERETLTQFFCTFFMQFCPRFDMRRFCLACLPVEKEKHNHNTSYAKSDCKDCIGYRKEIE